MAKGGVVGERELRSRLATEGGLTVGSLLNSPSVCESQPSNQTILS